MRLSHGDIEILITDMHGWVDRKKDPASQFIRTGFRGAIKLAIYNFHKTGNLEGSQRYLDDMMNRLKLNNLRRRAEAEQTLSGYTDWCGRSGVIAAQRRLRISLQLEEDIILGGEISRVDFDLGNDGYQGILLGVDDPNWKRQLRMPVLQLAIASRLQRDPEEVSVGIQDLDGTGLEVTQYPSSS